MDGSKAVAPLVDRVITRFAGAAADASERLRVRMGLVLLAGVLPVGLLLALVHPLLLTSEVGDVLASFHLALLPVVAVGFALAWFRRSIDLGIHVLGGYVITTAASVGLWGGAMLESALFFVLPISCGSLLVLSRRASAVWFVLGLALVAAYGLVHTFQPPAGIPFEESERASYWLAATLSVTWLLIWVVQIYDRARDTALDDLREASGALARARDSADTANRAKSEFLANMSHEIRTPMTAILGYADLLEDEQPPEEMRADIADAVRAIKVNGTHLLAIINDLLDLSKIEAGRLDIDLAPFSLVETIEELRHLLLPKAREKSISFDVEYIGVIPRAITSDAARLRQILINLLGNSIKFTERGGVRLRVRIDSEERPPVLEVDVVDSGIGMSRAQVEGLFQPFAQADSSTTRLYGGTGLGLSICRVLSDLMGGTISVRSAESVGSLFRVRIPIEIADRTPVSALDAEPSPSRVAPEPEELPRIDATILVVEDVLENRVLIKRLLERAGARVVLAENGREGVDRALDALEQGTPFDVVVMDIRMPVLSGYDATRELRARGYALPIMALTAHAMATERERCLSAGFDDYASKPIEPGPLARTVARLAALGPTAEAPKPVSRAAERATPAPRPDVRAGTWERIVRWFVPKHLQRDEETMRSARFVVGFSVIPLLVIPFWATAFFALYPPEVARPLSLALWAGIPLCIAVPLVMREIGSTVLAGNILIAYTLAILAASAYVNGGAGTPGGFWFVLVPMAAMVFVGGRLVHVWGAVASAACVGFWAIDVFSTPLRDYLAEGEATASWASSMASLQILVFAVLHLYERAKTDVFETYASRHRELVAAREGADAASRGKSDFLVNISHEIRTPMTAILGFADVLLEEWKRAPGASEIGSALVTIQRNGYHLLSIVNDLLDLSKIEAGRLEVERIAFSPAELVRDTLALMRVRADERGLDLRATYETPIPRRVESDPTRLRQVLINVLGNAIKFTDEGGIELAVRLVSHAAGHRLQFRVVDTGVGIASDQIDRLFEPYHVVDESRGQSGTGLGLSICRRLIELLSGEIRVQSVPGRGSTFVIEIPAGEVDTADMVSGSEASADEERRAEFYSEHECGRLDCRILLVEDGEDNQRLISHMLRKVGARVDVQPNGQRAVRGALAALAQGAPYDVILMDIQMPVMDGISATRALRAAGYERPIIALTAHAMIEERDRCLGAGCDDFATKPIRRTELISAILMALGRDR